MERATILDSLFYQNRLFFTQKTKHLYDTFASYHRAKDRDGNLLNKPADNQDDHAVDATAYPIGTIEFRQGDNVFAKAA
jgi:phage terminase large subunit